jgi:hypothetical protein
MNFMVQESPKEIKTGEKCWKDTEKGRLWEDIEVEDFF